MSSHLLHISVDCADPYKLASFWSRVLDHPLGSDDVPGDPEVVVLLPDGPTLLFLQVPEEKAGKNRLHLDLRPDGPRDEEIERVLGLGARIVADRRNPDGTGWAVLADPEGNEFCVVRSAAERGDVTP
ncbi:VOC family protein [Embleya sp. NBC_00896]|uniref:VOC family protein n=1 Tax=Embleya sp. NBC_00896 TaxID=2975961 RepID=UPI00386ACB3D|nr:VOC family protein [Embleya sp. NBC_00896]